RNSRTRPEFLKSFLSPFFLPARYLSRQRRIERICLRNSRKTAPPAEGSDREFLGCSAPRYAAFALLNNSRKTAAPAEETDCEFLGCSAPQDAGFALRKGGLNETTEE